MSTILKWITILVLVGVYVAALAAVLHPHVSPEYKAYFIDRTSTDYEPSHYNSSPQEGIFFNRPGLPQWVSNTHGFSVREPGGRWTDEAMGNVAGLTFNREFSGDVCVAASFQTIPWLVGREIPVRFGNQEQLLKPVTTGPATYDLQFHNLEAADHLDILLPSDLPTVVEREHDSSDTRRLGLDVSSLKVLPGQCPATSQ